jgi:hypothetical protein
MVQSVVGAARSVIARAINMPLLPELVSLGTTQAINMALLPELAGAQARSAPPHTLSASGWCQNSVGDTDTQAPLRVLLPELILLQ